MSMFDGMKTKATQNGMQMMLSSFGIQPEMISGLMETFTPEKIAAISNLVIDTQKRIVAIDEKLDYIISCMKAEETENGTTGSDNENSGSTNGSGNLDNRS